MSQQSSCQRMPISRAFRRLVESFPAGLSVGGKGTREGPAGGGRGEPVGGEWYMVEAPPEGVVPRFHMWSLES